MNNIEELENIIGYSFIHPEILERALTHSSYNREKNTKHMDNERLEFIGDGFLDAIVGFELFNRMKGVTEGRLTKTRALIVCEKALADVARENFTPLLRNPKYMIFGAAAQFGIFFTLCLASFLGFELNDAASIAIIGAADGPTSIFVANVLNSNYTAAIMVAAYSYMALVPIIQPAVIKLCTTRKERLIRMEDNGKPVSKTTRILFPVIVTIIVGIVAPDAVALIGFLMFGNLIRECGVLNSLSETAQKVLANLITIFLGITISSRMAAAEFLQWETLLIMGLGLFAFVFDTFGGVMIAKLMNLFTKKKINPMIGAAGISAFPMSARVVNKLGLQEDDQNFLLMHAVGVNVSGQVASVIAGGLILSFLAG